MKQCVSSDLRQQRAGVDVVFTLQIIVFRPTIFFLALNLRFFTVNSSLHI